MAQLKRIAVRETPHYVKFRLVDEATEEVQPAPERLHKLIEMCPPLLHWVGRARLMGALR